MKFHAMTLSLVALAATSVMADHTKDQTMRSDRMMKNDTARMDERVDHSTYPAFRDFATDSAGPRAFKKRTYTQEYPFYRQGSFTYTPKTEVDPWVRTAIYPDLVPVREVAAKVAEIQAENAREAAEFRAYAAKARSQGWTNVAAVYDYIAGDHERTAAKTANWLSDNNCPAPAVVTAASTDMSLDASVDHMIAMHESKFIDISTKLKTEKSETVRGLLIAQMTTISDHLRILRTLDRDMGLGRRELSAQLQSMMETTRTAHTSQEWSEMIAREDSGFYQTSSTSFAQTPYVIPADIQSEPRIVERTVTVERIVEKPVYVERIVERPVYAAPNTTIETQSTVKARVAGQRQTRSRGARRPAK